MKLKAPFPWFGGKSRASHLVWERFGDVRHYIEPFAGSLATLLRRPGEHQGRLETINDIDCHLVNLWRSVQYDPDEVIAAADYPVNEADLHAWHRWLVDWMSEERRERFKCDPGYYEPQVAGRWLWGICQWIGGGWCELVYRRSPEVATAGWGVVVVPKRQIPAVTTTGGGACGVATPSRRRPASLALSGGGTGAVHGMPPRKRPMVDGLSNVPGHGVTVVPERSRPHRGTPWVANTGYGVISPVADWQTLIYALCDRLRFVRVCCGDWKRVVTPAVTGHEVGPCGMLLDPPYSKEAGRSSCYAAEDWSVAHDVREWCLKQDHPNLRIALCGYEGEHDELEEHGWSVVEWKATGGMSRGSDSRAARNRYRERIWFSPSCLSEKQKSLFD